MRKELDPHTAAAHLKGAKTTSDEEDKGMEINSADEDKKGEG